MQQTAETATAHIVNYYVATVASRIVADNQEIADAIAGFSSIVLSKSAVVLSNLLYFKPNSCLLYTSRCV